MVLSLLELVSFWSPLGAFQGCESQGRMAKEQRKAAWLGIFFDTVSLVVDGCKIR